MFQKQKFYVWLILTIIFGTLATFTIANVIKLPVHDRARDVTRFGSGSEIDTAYDAKGNVVPNWQLNNPLDDIIKYTLLAIALFTFWKLLGTFIQQAWLRLLIIVISVPAVAWFYILATW